ncbi:hypothetical protein Q1695_007330 [Nippostrongylus brasiliensis]|nr:hypothetical protein Q1695_007330 [Nippostrongylus brasiliensis]
MQDHEVILDESSDESIVGEQAKKLFEICDKDEKGFISKNDLSCLSEFVSANEIGEIQRRVNESPSKQISKEEFTQIIPAEAPLMILISWEYRKTFLIATDKISLKASELLHLLNSSPQAYLSHISEN